MSRLSGLVVARPAATEALSGLLAAVAQRLTRLLETNVTLEPLGVAPLPAGRIAPGRHACLAALELGGRDEGALLELDPAATALLLRRLAGTSDELRAPGPLSRIEETALAWALLEVLDEGRLHRSVERVIPPRLVALSSDPAEVLPLAGLAGPRRRLCAVTVALSADGRSGRLRLVAPSGLLEAFLETFPEESAGRRAAPAVPAQWTGLEIDAGCRLAAGLLSPEERGALSEGDVVLLPGIDRAADGLSASARLSAPHFTLTGRLGGHSFTLERADARPFHPEPTMTEAPLPLAVELEVELARVRLPLAELYALREGAVLPLHVGTSPCVRLWLGDRMLARAELVDVDGQLGARLLSLSEPRP